MWLMCRYPKGTQEVCLCDDANQGACVVNNRQTTDSFTDHQMRGLSQRRLGVYRKYRLTHYLTDADGTGFATTGELLGSLCQCHQIIDGDIHIGIHALQCLLKVCAAGALGIMRFIHAYLRSLRVQAALSVTARC